MRALPVSLTVKRSSLCGPAQSCSCRASCPSAQGGTRFPSPCRRLASSSRGLLHEPAAFQMARPGQCHHAGPLARLNRPAMLPGKCPADHHLTSVTQVQGLGRVKVHALVHVPEGIPCPKGRPFCFSRRIDHPAARIHSAGHPHASGRSPPRSVPAGQTHRGIPPYLPDFPGKRHHSANGAYPVRNSAAADRPCAPGKRQSNGSPPRPETVWGPENPAGKPPGAACRWKSPGSRDISQSGCHPGSRQGIAAARRGRPGLPWIRLCTSGTGARPPSREVPEKHPCAS